MKPEWITVNLCTALHTETRFPGCYTEHCQPSCPSTSPRGRMMSPALFSRLSRKVLSSAGVAVLLIPATGAAQDVPAQAPPAYIAAVEGAADVERDGVSEPAAVNAPLVPGD